MLGFNCHIGHGTCGGHRRLIRLVDDGEVSRWYCDQHVVVHLLASQECVFVVEDHGVWGEDSKMNKEPIFTI